MPKYKAYITLYHVIKDIEASSAKEAQEIASEDYFWDEHIVDSEIKIEEEVEYGV